MAYFFSHSEQGVRRDAHALRCKNLDDGIRSISLSLSSQVRKYVCGRERERKKERFHI